MPGGEKAIYETNRIAYALLHQAMGDESSRFPLEDWLGFSRSESVHLKQILDKKIHCSQTTSMGRLFDGVASLVLGIHQVSYEGEAASCLESIADGRSTDPYPMPLIDAGDFIYLDWRPMIRAMVADRLNGRSPAHMSDRFHQGLAFAGMEIASKFPQKDGVLGGGCFINRRLVENMLLLFRKAGRPLFIPSHLPCGDGGIAAGQLAIALANQKQANHQI
ncbi:MAG: hypothetical protein ACKO23_01655 [Gemmataceae bacterium]